MAKSRKPFRKRRSLKLRPHREPAAAAEPCLLNITAEDDAGLVGTASGPAAVFASGAGRVSGLMRGGAISAGDEIILCRAAPPALALCIDLSAEQLAALQAIAAARGHATAADFVRSLLLPHLASAGSEV